jgi:hypothetical protein
VTCLLVVVMSTELQNGHVFGASRGSVGCGRITLPLRARLVVRSGSLLARHPSSLPTSALAHCLRVNTSPSQALHSECQRHTGIPSSLRRIAVRDNAQGSRCRKRKHDALGQHPERQHQNLGAFQDWQRRFIEYPGDIKVNTSLLSVVLHD